MLAEYQKLKSAQLNLESSNSMMESISNLQEGPTQILEIRSNTMKSRGDVCENLKKDVKQIIEPLQKVKALVTSENLEEIDLEELQKEMLEIHSNIQTLKQTTKLPLHTLKQQEKKLNEELEQFEKRMNEWDKPPIIRRVRKKIYSKNDTHPAVCDEVKIFMDFIMMSGGYENGWSIEDHNLFMKTRAKIKDTQLLAETLHHMLPDISIEQFKAHEEWYQTYLDLNSKRKFAVHKWRRNKIEEMHNKQMEEKILAKHRKLMREMAEEEKKRKIKEWQSVKRQQLNFEYKIKLAQEFQERIKHENNKIKNEEVKKTVSEWKKQRNAVIEEEKKRLEMMQPPDDSDVRAAIANRLIKKYQEMDKKMLEHRKLIWNTKKAAALEPPFSSTKTKEEAPRDPGRLRKPTKQWLRRTHKSESNSPRSSNITLNKIPKLGIPQWRKALSTL